MHLRNILKIKRAQSAVEYVSILLVVLGLFAAFLGQVRGHLQLYHERMVNRIATQ